MKTLYILLIILIPTLVQAQKQNILAKFTITESTLNGIDNTKFEMDRGGYFAFFFDENGLNLANISENWDQQSYGGLHEMRVKSQKETSSSYKADIFYFRWSYNNTYDMKTGQAKIKLTKIYKAQGIAFRLTMILPNLDILDYKGYMKGSLDFDKFIK